MMALVIMVSHGASRGSTKQIYLIMDSLQCITFNICVSMGFNVGGGFVFTCIVYKSLILESSVCNVCNAS